MQANLRTSDSHGHELVLRLVNGEYWSWIVNDVHQ